MIITMRFSYVKMGSAEIYVRFFANIIISLIFILLFSSIAIAQSKTIEKIPKKFIELDISSDITPIDLRGTGKKEDRAIRAYMATYTSNVDTIILLTKAENDPDQKFHYVRMPDDKFSTRAWKSPTGCVELHKVFLRDANDAKKIYMIETYRSYKDGSKSDASFNIGLYKLGLMDFVGAEIKQEKPSDDKYYGFLQVRNISVPYNVACNDDEIRKLEEDQLSIKIQR